ncbi:hypothetical protein OCH239_04965 [Roseivivax halodurans JCM 10272]|uniref:Transcriptional activator HlyU n=1 Tax=Roseivivax halodurans JCM 10272 TaxID=1449350 RepID=X7EE91_9RHOB|nr:HlyU family transcriptional regulator [Roseivivax halodurans]ETX14205.1 hypothetical protein OCH239_04965 [Roseivivax halodurans JCM 10272]
MAGFFSNLFGGGNKDGRPAPAETVEYNGYHITPEPLADGGQFRIAALIECDVGGERKSHQLIRADVLSDYDAAVEASLSKARQAIDQQGTALFD